mgnify:CR=1 FL=1
MKIADNPFGTVNPPPGVEQFSGGDVSGLQVLLNIVLRTLIVGAGVYAVINLILAGFWYIGGSGDSKRIWEANNKIWHSLLGLIIAAGAFVIAGVIGKILFGDYNALLQIKIFTPE